MKFVMSLLAICLASSLVFASSGGVAPYAPETDNRFNAIEQVLENQTTDGLHALKVARATYDFSTQGGGSAADIDSGVTLPANAIIVRSYMYVQAALTPSGTTMQVYCEDANNIKTATDITGSAAGSLIEGQSTGAASAFKAAIAAACNIKFRLGIHAGTAGKVNVFVEYVTSD